MQSRQSRVAYRRGLPEEIVVQDVTGEDRILRQTHRGIQVKRDSVTPVLALNQGIGPLIGARIRQERLRKGWTLAYLCKRAGIVSTVPKNRMYEIECSSRSDCVSIGTLYALALALGVPASALLPTAEEVAHLVSVATVETERVEVSA